jgi:nucleolar protein 9
MIEIVQRICDEISPEFQSLISDRYASHVIRALLCILSGKSTADVASLRSKSSIAFKQYNKAGHIETRKGAPDAFKGILATLVGKVLNADRSTFRLLVVDPVANPVISLLASLGMFISFLI